MTDKRFTFPLTAEELRLLASPNTRARLEDPDYEVLALALADALDEIERLQIELDRAGHDAEVSKSIGQPEAMSTIPRDPYLVELPSGRFVSLRDVRHVDSSGILYHGNESALRVGTLTDWIALEKALRRISTPITQEDKP